MNRMLALSVMTALLVFGSGCGSDSQESLADETMPVMREMVATITTIKDEASAKAAKPKLEAIAKKMKSISERRSKLSPPTEAEMKSVIDKHGAEMEELQKKMIGSMMTIQFDPKIQAVLEGVDLKMD